MGTATERIEDVSTLRREIVLLGSGRVLQRVDDVVAAVHEPDLVVLRWPAESSPLDAARERSCPRLLVVEGDEEPPLEWDALEDWIRLPADRRDVRARVGMLRRRVAEAPDLPRLDGYDRLLFRGCWVSLTSKDYKLIEPLVDRFDRVVTHAQVVAHLTDTEPSSNGAARVRLTRLRRRIAPLGLEIRTVRPHGISLTAIAG